MSIANAPATDAVLVHADTPPSLNHTGSRGHWRRTHTAKKHWQEVFEVLLMEAGLARGLDYVYAEASLRFPVRRRRDEGNYRWLLEKALGDALVRGAWLPDDTPERFRFGPVKFEPLTGGARTAVGLWARRRA